MRNIYLSNPKPGHPTGGALRPGHDLSFFHPRKKQQLVLDILRKHGQRKSFSCSAYPVIYVCEKTLGTGSVLEPRMPGLASISRRSSTRLGFLLAMGTMKHSSVVWVWIRQELPTGDPLSAKPLGVYFQAGLKFVFADLRNGWCRMLQAVDTVGAYIGFQEDWTGFLRAAVDKEPRLRPSIKSFNYTMHSLDAK